MLTEPLFAGAEPLSQLEPVDQLPLVTFQTDVCAWETRALAKSAPQAAIAERRFILGELCFSWKAPTRPFVLVRKSAHHALVSAA